MGLFSALKGAVGMGQPVVHVQLEAAEVARGGMLRGVARVTGGERAVPVAAFDIELRGVTPNVGAHTVQRARVELGGAPLAPGQSREAPFELQVKAGTAPSGATQYELVVSCDCPGLDPSTKAPVRVLEAMDPLASEDVTRFHVLPEARSFRHSSVRGDFRLTLLPDGFLATWKQRTTCRNVDGSLRWVLDGWGRTAGPSPDGTRIAIADGNKRLAIVEAASGELVGEPIDCDTWVNDVVWLADGSGLVLNGTDSLIVIDSQGQRLHTAQDLGWGTLYLSSLCAGPGRSVYVSDSNASRVARVDLDRGVAGTVELRYPQTLHASRDGSMLSLDANDEVVILDAQLARRASYPVPGKKGVRYVGQEPHSHTHFKSNAHLSPDHRSLLVNDGSGLLWLLEAPTGKPIRSYDRAVLDYVEDALFWDAQHFIAITNDGRVRGMSLEGAVVFEDQDA